MVAAEGSVPARRSGRIAPILFAIAIASSAYVWWRIAWPLLILDDSAVAAHAKHLAPVMLHAIGGTCMLLCGSVALYIGWTRTFFRGHKIFGYVYLVGGSAAGIAALALVAAESHPGIVVRSATGTLAAAWLAASFMAYRAIRNRRFDVHREWMVRSYVLTWTFVFCRMVQASPGVTADSDATIGAIIWLTWVVPMIVCELSLQWSRTGQAAARA